jgi:rhodanese-related sulfurtransferase
MRRMLIPVLVGGLLLAGAGPASPPDYPVSYIKVDELKAQLDRGVKADIIDVRTWSEYVDVHIKGARSMPIKAVSDRAYEISQTGLVVLY